MELGIFSKVYSDCDFNSALKEIKNQNMKTIQFNFSNVGLPSLPSEIPEDKIKTIKDALMKNGVSISVISGTFNTLELDEKKRKENFKKFSAVIKAAKLLGVPNVSISTGSFDQENFWRVHPENHTEKAWDLLLSTLEPMIKTAVENNITIVFEPEQANVVSTSKDSLRLLETFKISNLKVLFDAANVVTKEDSGNLIEKIKTCIIDLKDYIAVAHCKDCIVDKNGVTFAAVGKGNLPLQDYIKELKKYYDGSLIMHGLEKEDVPFAVKYVNEVL